MVDQKGLTALDTVKDMPSKKSRQIATLILGENHANANAKGGLDEHIEQKCFNLLSVCLSQAT